MSDDSAARLCLGSPVKLKMIITIDGPAGTGKSSVSQEVARQLGFDFLDTGAMYRAIGLAAHRAGISLDDAEALGELAERVTVDFDWTVSPPEVRLESQRIGSLIRTEAASHAASKVAVVARVRTAMVRLQQKVGRVRTKLVTEGRDQGTIVFPNAELKIFLEATAEERARRRKLQLEAKGETVEFATLLAMIIERDARDSGRAVSPLRPAEDARHIDTTHMTQRQVTDRILELAREVMAR